MLKICLVAFLILSWTNAAQAELRAHPWFGIWNHSDFWRLRIDECKKDKCLVNIDVPGISSCPYRTWLLLHGNTSTLEALDENGKKKKLLSLGLEKSANSQQPQIRVTRILSKLDVGCSFRVDEDFKLQTPETPLADTIGTQLKCDKLSRLPELSICTDDTLAKLYVQLEKRVSPKKAKELLAGMAAYGRSLEENLLSRLFESYRPKGPASEILVRDDEAFEGIPKVRWRGAMGKYGECVLSFNDCKDGVCDFYEAYLSDMDEKREPSRGRIKVLSKTRITLLAPDGSETKCQYCATPETESDYTFGDCPGESTDGGRTQPKECFYFCGRSGPRVTYFHKTSYDCLRKNLDEIDKKICQLRDLAALDLELSYALGAAKPQKALADLVITQSRWIEVRGKCDSQRMTLNEFELCLRTSYQHRIVEFYSRGIKPWAESYQ